MRFVDNLPCIAGSSDAKDSAMFAGTLVWLGLQHVDLSRYFIDGLPVRHPTEPGANDPHKFSRDQLIMLATGLYFSDQGIELAESLYHRAIIADKHAPNWKSDDDKKKLLGADKLLPQHINHLRLCAWKDGETRGYDWLVEDIRFNAKYTPDREQNQLQAMCYMAGPEYVKFYKEKTPDWKASTLNYYCQGHGKWRNEPEVGEAIIRKLEACK